MAIWQDLIVCKMTDQLADGKFKDPCGFEDLIELSKNLFTNLVVLATFFTVIMFMYAGFKLLTSGGSPSGKQKAKDIFSSVLIGYLWILGAWVVVYTITSALLADGFSLLG